MRSARGSNAFRPSILVFGIGRAYQPWRTAAIAFVGERRGRRRRHDPRHAGRAAPGRFGRAATGARLGSVANAPYGVVTMPITDLLGRHATLPVRRLATPGAFLALDPGNAREDAPALLLPRAEVPANTQLGDELAVFVHLDSEDRPIATTRTPAVALGEVAFLPVRNLTSFGAFVDWGLPKDLLVPFAEQTCDLRVGDRHAIGLYIDATRRLGGTMRVNPLLREPGEFEVDARVDGEIWRIERGIGTFVILQRRFVGLVPESEPHGLAVGQATRARIANILADGKLELSLRGHAFEEIEGDAQRILGVLGRPGAPRVGDRSSPEQIRSLFGLSKKAFKRASGRLLREGVASIDEDGFLVRRR
jgi:predicted RNA-binding protein (virulence factor B family)